MFHPHNLVSSSIFVRSLPIFRFHLFEYGGTFLSNIWPLPIESRLVIGIFGNDVTSQFNQVGIL